MSSYAIFFEFQERRVCLAIVTPEYKAFDMVMDIVESKRVVTVGYLTSKALENPAGGYIYNFRPSWKLELIENTTGICKLLRSIQTEGAEPANTKVRSRLQIKCFRNFLEKSMWDLHLEASRLTAPPSSVKNECVLTFEDTVITVPELTMNDFYDDLTST